MGLIVGFDTAAASKATLIGSLLLFAVADNLADSPADSTAIHAYQESQGLVSKQAFRSTVTSFVRDRGADPIPRSPSTFVRLIDKTATCSRA